MLLRDTLIKVVWALKLEELSRRMDCTDSVASDVNMGGSLHFTAHVAPIVLSIYIRRDFGATSHVNARLLLSPRGGPCQCQPNASCYPEI